MTHSTTEYPQKFQDQFSQREERQILTWLEEHVRTITRTIYQEHTQKHRGFARLSIWNERRTELMSRTEEQLSQLFSHLVRIDPVGFKTRDGYRNLTFWIGDFRFIILYVSPKKDTPHNSKYLKDMIRASWQQSLDEAMLGQPETQELETHPHGFVEVWYSVDGPDVTEIRLVMRDSRSRTIIFDKTIQEFLAQVPEKARPHETIEFNPYDVDTEVLDLPSTDMGEQKRRENDNEEEKGS